MFVRNMPISLSLSVCLYNNGERKEVLSVVPIETGSSVSCRILNIYMYNAWTLYSLGSHECTYRPRQIGESLACYKTDSLTVSCVFLERLLVSSNVRRLYAVT